LCLMVVFVTVVHVIALSVEAMGVRSGLGSLSGEPVRLTELPQARLLVPITNSLFVMFEIIWNVISLIVLLVQMNF
jgi:hypothetical protein